MSILNKQLPEFKVDAFHNGEFKTVTSDDVKGKWAIFLFYPADFTFVCPTELEDMAEHYEQLQGLGVEVRISLIKRGTTAVTLSVKSSSQCWVTRPALSRVVLT